MRAQYTRHYHGDDIIKQYNCGMNCALENIMSNPFNSDEDEDEIDGDEETIFKYKLDKLRKKAEVFLHMLNDMTKRNKELPQGSPVAEQYKSVPL